MNKRQEMIKTIKDKYGLDSDRVLSAMAKVPREEFAPEEHRVRAYDDIPIPIGHEQTMSQPFTVAFMTDLLIEGDRDRERVKDWKVLEIGTGSGYQGAVLAELVDEVYTVEIIEELAERAEETLKRLDYDNVHVKSASGEYGWKENSPYDAIMVTAGIEGEVPQELFDQLKEGGIMVAPVGSQFNQIMTRFKKKKDGKIESHEFGGFRFVPFVREG